MLEGWSVLAALARETRRSALGTLVTGVTYRNPALLAKTVTTLDVMSGGRAILGLGAAWNEEEHEGYGYEFPPIRERMDRLDEALTIVQRDVHRGPADVRGPHYRIDEALNVPEPDPARRPADHGRWRRGTADAADRREARRHDALVPARARHPPSQERGARAATARRSGATRRRSSGRWRRPVVVAGDRGRRAAILEAMPPERRPHVRRRHARAGRRGASPLPGRRLHRLHVQQLVYRTTEQIELVGEVLRLISPS